MYENFENFRGLWEDSGEIFASTEERLDTFTKFSENFEKFGIYGKILQKLSEDPNDFLGTI